MKFRKKLAFRLSLPFLLNFLFHLLTFTVFLNFLFHSEKAHASNDLPDQTVGTLELWKNNQSTLTARTNARNQTTEMLFQTPTFCSCVDTQFNAPDMRNPSDTFAGDPASRPNEKLKISISKSIPQLGIHDDITYQSTSRIITSSMSKELISHVNLSLDAVCPIDPMNSDVKVPGESLKLNYDIHF